MNIYKAILGIATVFVVFSLWLYGLSLQFDDHDSEVHFPQDLEDLKKIASTLHFYQQQHYSLVVLLFCSAYLYKQTFAIPGSVFTNILGGALFGTWIAFPLVCLLSATGASLCFLLSKHFGSHILIRKFPDRIASLQSRINENNQSLFYFLLSARLLPITPNWFLNMSSPVVGIPLRPFFISVLLGLVPYNFICVHTGSVLSSVSSLDDMFSVSTFLGMLLIALVAMLPGIIIRRRNNLIHAKD